MSETIGECARLGKNDRDSARMSETQKEEE